MHDPRAHRLFLPGQRGWTRAGADRPGWRLLAGLLVWLGFFPPVLAHPEGPGAEVSQPPGDQRSESSDARGKTDPPAAPKWDVEHPPGPQAEVTIDTDEGTWLNLDVSPDGREIVFDLLGDLYTVPITGGDARSLTSGMSWDMQPRFSPDGRFIAFTSDRSGGDNLWVMNRDGSSPAAVSSERFRLLSGPAWAPDSQFIAGRKHFTSGRSLGAGEIWLFHRAGGSGVQLTRRPTEQKDVGEPAFSPDGRFLYYSLDATPGPSFEYNKDPNKGIYAIKRLELETGEQITLIDGPGGAIRPTPSPDGRSLAFIRRVRARSVLTLFDLQSGRETPLFDGLDKDQQETWAIHGVYPTLAWTPDSQQIVFWADGKLKRLEVASTRVQEIPFRVRSTRRVSQALRFVQAVSLEQFPVLMVRGAQRSPDGRRVVFEALGKLYVRELPDGPPRRLTSQEDHFELEPSWSRDGHWIAYVSWNDRDLGAVRVVSAKGPGRAGAGRIVTPAPGHYHEPCFAPDGKQLVYRKARGGYLLSPLYAQDPGIYLLALQGERAVAAPVILSREGSGAHFGASPLHLYLTRAGEETAQHLVRIRLDTRKELTLLKTEKAMELRVSPDERWVAMREHFNVYIAPLIQAGQAIELGRKPDAYPVARVTRDSGEDLHWSGDSRSLSWTLGPTLYTRTLQDSFAFLAGAPQPLPEPPTEGIRLGFDRPAAIPTGTLALVGGRIITLRGEEVIEDGTLVVSRNRIVAVGPRNEVIIPAGARVIDVVGKTLIPGLVDVHWHGGMGVEGIVPQQSWVAHASLAFGVTTVHDPSNETREIFAASELARAGQIVAPRIFSTGTILYGAKATITAEIESYEDAISHVRRMKGVGAFSVKSYNQPRRDQRQQVIAAGRELEVMVVPEGGATFQHNMTMIMDGHTGIEHAVPLGRLYRDVIQLWAGSRTGYTPTLGVGYGGLSGEEYWYQHGPVWNHPRLSRFVPREILDARARRVGQVPDEELHHVLLARSAKALRDAGVSVQLGAHGQREGLAAHWELWMLQQGGFTPLEALRAGTLAGAWYLGLDREIGSLEVGKLADVAVLEVNPLEDLRKSDQVLYTMVNGVLYDAQTMREIAPGSRPEPEFYWER